MTAKTAIYPGTFDPVTFGHLDVLERASKLFEKIIISVASGTAKTTLFTAAERADMLSRTAGNIKNTEIDVFEGLLVDYAEKKNANVIIRGLRAISDFEFEFQMALTNRKIAPDIETVFLMPNEKFSYISSTLVKEIAVHNGELKSFVPDYVVKKLMEKFGYI